VRFDRAIREAGYIPMSGQIVDAGLVSAPKQRNTEAEKNDIKEGRRPGGVEGSPGEASPRTRPPRVSLALSTISNDGAERRNTKLSRRPRPRGEMVRALVAVLEALLREFASITRRIEQAVAELPDGRIIMSFPRTGRVCAAQILAELGDARERFPTADQLAAEAGVCPVTHASKA
jgi:transposase